MVPVDVGVHAPDGAHAKVWGKFKPKTTDSKNKEHCPDF